MSLVGSRLILGTAQLCSRYGVLDIVVDPPEGGVGSFLHHAKLVGFDAIDTAPSYPGAEEAIGSSSVNVAFHTKFDSALSAMDSIRSSLRRLRCERVEVAYLHDPLAPLHNGGKAIDEVSSLMDEYFDFLGVSVYSTDALRASLQRTEIKIIQIPVNPLWRELVDSLPNRTTQRPTIFGRSLLAQGLLLVRDGELPTAVRHLEPFIARFQAVCRSLERSILECALLWSRDHPLLDGLILGATSIEQLDEISSCLNGPALSAEERALIDDISIPSTPIFDPRTWS